MAEAAYFHMDRGVEKCFVESVPAQQVITVSHRHLENPGVGCMLIFKDPGGKQVFSKRIDAEDQEMGKTVYMAQSEGMHRICIECEGHSWLQQAPMKWEVSVDIGDVQFTRNPVTRGDFHSVEKSLMGALARIEAISAENEYEKSTEMDFRNVSEQMNSHIVWVALFIVAMEIALCVWQISHLRDFFRREKLF